jgi:replicative DNA helicase
VKAANPSSNGTHDAPPDRGVRLALTLPGYPRRESFFAHRFIRLMARSCVGSNIASLAGVSGRRIRSGDVTPQHIESLMNAADVARDWRWITDYRQGPKADQIAAAALRNARQLSGLSLIVVDYLTRIRPDDPKAPRYQQTGTSVRKIQDLARTMGVPVLLLAQLNREAADSERPALHHIRESGDVEQDADAVLLLHQETDQHGELMEQFRLMVAKQRNGPRGEIPFERNPTTFQFREAEMIPAC